MSSTATRRAIYGKLAADTTLTNLLGTPAPGYNQSIYHYDAPQTAGYPLIVFSKSSGVATGAMGAASVFDTDIWLIKAVDQSMTADTAEAIQERVKTLLNDASLSISGGSLLYLRRESDIEFLEVEDGVSYRHAGSMFRVIVAPS